MNLQGIWPSDFYEADGSPDSFLFSSPRAGGPYRISGSALKTIENYDHTKKMLLTEAIWRTRPTPSNREVWIDSLFLERALDVRPPSVQERFSRGLSILVHLFPTLGSKIKFGPVNSPFQTFLGASYSDTFSEAMLFIQEYSAHGYLEIHGSIVNDLAVLKILIKGFIEGRAPLKNANADTAFVAMWFSPEMTDAFDQGIEPSVRIAGYRANRIDRTEHNNKIDDEIIAGIRDSRFLIADFTSEPEKPRGGVYYEAGFAQGLGIPVIWSCRSDLISQVHFDTRQYNHIVWSSVAELKEKLLARILATLGRGPLQV